MHFVFWSDFIRFTYKGKPPVYIALSAFLRMRRVLPWESHVWVRSSKTKILHLMITTITKARSKRLN